MPGTGKVDARGVASKLGSSFIEIELALVVVVCGGVPKIYEGKEIVLGDVIMSTALVEHDFVKQYPQGRIKKDSLEDNRGRPNSEIRAFVAKIKADRISLQDRISTRLEVLCQQPGLEGSRYPGADKDKLFKPTYCHNTTSHATHATRIGFVKLLLRRPA
jgi:hypothetical protein